MFQPLALDSSMQSVLRINDLIDTANSGYLAALSNYKQAWLEFWDPNKSVADMQAQLDKLAAAPSGTSAANALVEYFAKAARFQAYIQVEYPGAFSDSVPDKTGKFNMFLTAGWICAPDNTGRLIATAPCQWVIPG